jgi:hypothetical protein
VSDAAAPEDLTEFANVPQDESKSFCVPSLPCCSSKCVTTALQLPAQFPDEHMARRMLRPHGDMLSLRPHQCTGQPVRQTWDSPYWLSGARPMA